MANAQAAKQQALSQITQVQIEVTNRCNLKCSICWRALREQKLPLKEVSFKEFKSAIDKLISVFPIKELNTQGLGEPLLCKQILEMLQYAKSKDLSVWFVSNGTVINDAIAEGLVSSRVDKVRISIDTADECLYASIKKGSTLPAVIRNIQRINFYKNKLCMNTPAIAINAVMLKDTLGSLELLFNQAKTLDIHEITLIPLVNFSKGLATTENQIDFSSPEFKSAYKNLAEKAGEYGIELNLGISMETKESKYCHSGIYVDVDGFVHPCCNIVAKKFGNIYHDDINEIVNNLFKFRDWVDSREITCRDCNKAIDFDGEAT